MWIVGTSHRGEMTVYIPRIQRTKVTIFVWVDIPCSGRQEIAVKVAQHVTNPTMIERGPNQTAALQPYTSFKDRSGSPPTEQLPAQKTILFN